MKIVSTVLSLALTGLVFWAVWVAISQTRLPEVTPPPKPEHRPGLVEKTGSAIGKQVGRLGRGLGHGIVEGVRGK